MLVKYLAAYLLLSTAGKSEPSAEDIKSVLSSVGIEAEDDRISALLSDLKGKDVSELIAEGTEKLASVPSGGAAAAGGAPAAGGATEAAAAEEEKEEEKEESDDDMGMGLFD